MKLVLVHNDAAGHARSPAETIPAHPHQKRQLIYLVSNDIWLPQELGIPCRIL